ncbi:MAG: putative damage-inducible protein DinB, partial [Gammaproteobacteria bacterium]
MLEQFKLLVTYNQLMNRRMFEALSALSQEQLNEDRGAFFSSIQGSLNHILVGDIIWLKRFAAHPAFVRQKEYLDLLEQPTSLDIILFDDFESLKQMRETIDGLLVDWISPLNQDDLKGVLNYKNMAGNPFCYDLVSLMHH